MKPSRRLLYGRNSKTVKVALRAILRGIHYRHEFARRNDALVEDSEELFSLFSIDKERAATFMAPGTTSSLTLELEEFFRDLKPPKSLEAREKLRAFLRKWRVLPMARPNKPFFPHYKDSDDATVWNIWERLVRFEFFALARLKVGHPVIFPVMYVGLAAVPEDVPLHKLLSLRDDTYPMLTDFQVPNVVINNYLRAFGALTQEKSPEMKSAGESKRSYKRQWKRLRSEPLDAILAAYDLDHNPPSKVREKEKRIIEIYQKRFEEKEATATMETIYKVWRDWLKRAEEFKNDYFFII